MYLETRLCADEKEEEDDDKNVNLTPSSDDRPASESGESGRTIEEMDPEIDLDVTCNPMVSDVEELEENDDALRGDRIGNTTYSERHVLKILMKWVQVIGVTLNFSKKVFYMHLYFYI